MPWCLRIRQPLYIRTETPGIPRPWSAVHKQNKRPFLRDRLRGVLWRQGQIPVERQAITGDELNGRYLRHLIDAQRRAVGKEQFRRMTHPIIKVIVDRAIIGHIRDRPEVVGVIAGENLQIAVAHLRQFIQIALTFFI